MQDTYIPLDISKCDNEVNCYESKVFISACMYGPENACAYVCTWILMIGIYTCVWLEQVSDFIGTFQNVEEEKYQLQILRFYPEHNFAFGMITTTVHV